MKHTIKKAMPCAVAMLATLCLCVTVILSAGGTAAPVAAYDGVSTTTSAVVDYATKLEYDTSPMRVGETRAIRFYHPQTGTATGAWFDSVSPLLSVSYEDGSDTVYVTALEVGEASLYICADGCAFGAYAYLTVEVAAATTTTFAAEYKTQVEKGFVTMRVGQTRAITFYHPETLTATGATIYGVSDNVSYTYEEGSDTVYITALASGEAELSILADGCTQAARVWFFIESDTVQTTVCGLDPSPEDVNFDGFINMMDVLQLYTNVSTGEGAVTWGGTQCDMNADGTVNMMDVLLLYAQISGGDMSYH